MSEYYWFLKEAQDDLEVVISKIKQGILTEDVARRIFLTQRNVSLALRAMEEPEAEG